MRNVIYRSIQVIIVIMVVSVVYEWWRPMPGPIDENYFERTVPADSVVFFADNAATSSDGRATSTQTIWDRVFPLIDSSEHYMLLSLYQYNNFSAQNSTTSRDYARELTMHLTDRLKRSRTPAILETDQINSYYGDTAPLYLETLARAGVKVIMTDNDNLRDPNLFFSSVYRPFFAYFATLDRKPWFPNPLTTGRTETTLRTLLQALQMKGNERNIIVIDHEEKTKEGTIVPKMFTIISSANVTQPGKSEGNVALLVRDKVWKDVIQSGAHVAELSNDGIVSYAQPISDETGPLHVQLLTQKHIRDKILDIIGTSTRGDQFSIALTYLSDRDVISALVAASLRGANFRIILDQNSIATGFSLPGIPNRSAAKELIEKSVDGISIKLADTHDVQFQPKLFYGKTATSSLLLVSTADFTRRDLDGFNLESAILVTADKAFPAWNDADAYFKALWENRGIAATYNYEKTLDDSVWRGSFYRMMERTGMSDF
jgi:hypothetical protein